MADFSALKTSIQNYIKQNGNEEITGNLLQQILLSMVSTLGDSAINDLVTALSSEVTARQNADGTLQTNINNEATARGNADNTLLGLIDGITDDIENGYVYAGIATPSTTPASGKVFYLALTAGTYTNFGATVVPQGVNILKYNGSAWSLDTFIGLDDAPTQGSNNLVKSGGVVDSIIKDGSAFDLSAYNSGTTYADLAAALTALNELPAVFKKGGMSMKFVQSSDNKYVQARLMANAFTTDVTQWQSVDDEPTAGSENIVKSGGVFDYYTQKNIDIKNISNNSYDGVYIDPNSNKWNPAPNTSCKIYPIQWFDRITIYANNSNEARVAFLKSDKISNYESADFSAISGFTGLIIIEAGKTMDFERPSDAKYLYAYDENASYLPANIYGNFSDNQRLFNYLTNSVDNPQSKFSVINNIEDGEQIGNYYIEPEGANQGVWRSLDGIHGVFIDIRDISTLKITANNNSEARFALLKSTSIGVGTMADFSSVTGFTNIKILEAGNVSEFEKPADANYLYLTTTYGSTVFTPAEITMILSGVEIVYHRTEDLIEKSIYKPASSDILRVDGYYMLESGASAGQWKSLSGATAYFIELTDITTISISANLTNGSRYALLKTPTILGDWEMADFSDVAGYDSIILMTPGSSVKFNKPSDANYLYIFDYEGQPSYPSEISLETNGISTVLNKNIDKKFNLQAYDYNTDKEYGFYILESGENKGKWRALQGTTAIFIDITNVSDISITANLTNGSRYALLKNPIVVPESLANFSDDTGFESITTLAAGGFVKFKKPSDAKYLYIFDYEGQPSYPASINLEMENINDYTKPLIQSFSKSKLAVLAESDLVTPNIHISVDDCISCFYDLVTNNRQSIYDCEFFSQMKTLHDTYGVKITCNCFLHYYHAGAGIENFYLIDTPNTWKDEFQAAKGWLRFAFHGYDNILWNTQDVTPYYNQFVQAIYQITEDYDCIDTVTRTQSFSGSLTNVKAMMNAEHGVIAFLASCKNGVDLSYYLDREESDYIIRHGVKVDTKNNVLFIKSSIPLDNDSVADVLVDYEESPCSRKYVEIFFHLFPTSTYVFPETISKCNQVCDYFITQKGYESHFLMDLFK